MGEFAYFVYQSFTKNSTMDVVITDICKLMLVGLGG
jgi:hypothetical protein